MRDEPFVAKRVSNNVDPAHVNVSKREFWDGQLTALLTSQQRSGPDSPVSK
jgi:hypothetical protein